MCVQEAVQPFLHACNKAARNKAEHATGAEDGGVSVNACRPLCIMMHAPHTMNTLGNTSIQNLCIGDRRVEECEAMRW
jgi:hypothetical protein